MTSPSSVGSRSMRAILEQPGVPQPVEALRDELGSPDRQGEAHVVRHRVDGDRDATLDHDVGD
jgi:hypothetical protein